MMWVEMEVAIQFRKDSRSNVRVIISCIACAVERYRICLRVSSRKATSSGSVVEVESGESWTRWKSTAARRESVRQAREASARWQSPRTSSQHRSKIF